MSKKNILRNSKQIKKKENYNKVIENIIEHHLPRKSSFSAPGKPGSQSQTSNKISCPNAAYISYFNILYNI